MSHPWCSVCNVFKLRFTSQANEVIKGIRDPKRLKKVLSALGKLETDPRHPGLQSHPYRTFFGPGGEQLWESYVEQNTPNAWRIWWYYSQGEQAVIIVTDLGGHP